MRKAAGMAGAAGALGLGAAGFAFGKMGGAPVMAAGLAAAGLASRGYKWGSGAGKKDKDQEKEQSIAKDSFVASHKVLSGIHSIVVEIRQWLQSKQIAESQKRELALAKNARFNEFIGALEAEGMTGPAMDKEKKKSSGWGWIAKLFSFAVWGSFFKKFLKLLKLGGIASLLGIGSRLLLGVLAPLALGVAALILIPLLMHLWPDIKQKIMDTMTNIKNTILSVLSNIGDWISNWTQEFIDDSFLSMFFTDEDLEEIEDPTANMGMDDTLGEDDQGRASSVYVIQGEIQQQESFADPSVLEDQRPADMHPEAFADPSVLEDAMGPHHGPMEAEEGRDWFIDDEGKMNIIIRGHPKTEDPDLSMQPMDQFWMQNTDVPTTAAMYTGMSTAPLMATVAATGQEMRPTPKVTDKLLNFIQDQEGFEGNAYLDAAGVPTIGYGHTEGVEMGDTITQMDALEQLMSDILKHQQRAKDLIDEKFGQGTWSGMNQDQRDMLTDMEFNVGLRKFPNFTEAVVNEDKAGMLKEHKRFYTDSETGNKKPLQYRNEEFKKQFILDYDNAPGQPVEMVSATPQQTIPHLQPKITVQTEINHDGTAQSTVSASSQNMETSHGTNNPYFLSPATAMIG